MGLLTRKQGGGILARLTQPNWSGYGSNRVYAMLPSGSGGTWITVEDAIKISALWACMRAISEPMGASIWQIFNEKPNGDREYMPGSTAYRLLNVRPNPEMIPFSFHQAMTACAILYPGSFAEIERDFVGRPAALWPLHPTRCTLIREGGELKLSVTNVGKEPTILAYKDVYHIHGMSIDGTCGLDMVSTAARTLLHAAAADKFGLSYFDHGTAMGGVLSSDQDLKQPELDDLRVQVEKRVAGPENAFRFLVLGSGMKFQPLSASLNEGQNKELREFLVYEVCRWAGVPPHRAYQLDRATFSNIEHQGIEFNRSTLRMWGKRHEQEIDYKLLPPGAISVACDLEWASEGDSKTVAETGSILVRNGLLKRNEWRRRRGLNSLGKDGDTLTVESQLTTLEAVANGETSPAKTSQQPKQADDPNTPRIKQAARALIHNAAGRWLRRYHHRTESLAAKKWKTPADFSTAIAPQSCGQHEYVIDQLAEVFSTLAAVLGDRFHAKLDAANSAIRWKAEARMREDHEAASAAFDGVRLDTWCNIDSRADELAAELSSELEVALQ